MIARVDDLYEKEVICIKDGTRLGIIGDIEINTSTGSVESIIICGRRKMFGIFGRDEDVIVPWCCIQVFGDDIVLVNFEPPRHYTTQKQGIISKLFDL